MPIPGAEQRSTLGKTLVPNPLYDPHGTDVEWGRTLSATTPDGMGGVASIASEVVSGVIVDGVFDLLGTLPARQAGARGLDRGRLATRVAAGAGGARAHGRCRACR